jgi:hypothetical protein
MPRHKTPSHDPRLDTIAPLVEEKKIITLGDVFHFIPRTTVARGIGIDPKTLAHLLLDPEDIAIRQIHQLADLFHLSREQVYDLLNAHIREVKKGDWRMPALDYKGREI